MSKIALSVGTGTRDMIRHCVAEEGFKKYKPKSFADLLAGFREYKEKT